ncbi:MAG: NADP-dependent isocitrate dehydrogenase [Bacteroidota bacterium]|nr:NADP-dependent isocitrate dehydrogenase [Bacteroidota bacterium]
MKKDSPKIVYTKIDEAPALASYSLLPIVEAFTKSAGIEIETRDISLAGRVIANFSENLTSDQKISDELAYLGELVNKAEANIIKLPNISASVPQLKAVIKELQDKGYDIPNYPEEPKNDEEKKLQDKFSVTLGSAVNPVLRQGNADRRVAPSVKANAQANPHRMMKDWPAESNTHVAHMKGNDFFANEKSIVSEKNQMLSIEHQDANGKISLLKKDVSVLVGEVFDATFMGKKALESFIEEELQDAKDKDLLYSIHLKATMMKVSDPVIFGHFVSVYFKNVYEKHADLFKEIGVNPELGLGDLYPRLEKLPADKKAEIEADIKVAYDARPDLAMVDSDKGITNLHAGNNIIIDASMPVVIRDGGRMWNPAGKLQDTKAIIPDTSYAEFYQTVIDSCQKDGAFDPSTMGNVSNVGLMAQKAEEYGSHDKTFVMPANGKVYVKDEDGKVLIEHAVEEGDIWRASQAKDVPIQDWVKLAVKRAKDTGTPAIFWLDETRGHDAVMIKKVNKYLKDHDTDGLDIQIMKPTEAMAFTIKRVRAGKNTVSVTGNVLRDYLTDLFPILELGTSAKMLSIVPLLNGGGLFETGAGGSAPKHVQQFMSEGHLRWDSLGEFLALTVSLEHLSKLYDNKEAGILAETLDTAVSKYLSAKKSPSRIAGELDNRGSHYYLAQYWAEAISEQSASAELKENFTAVFKQLKDNEQTIMDEIAGAEGKAKDIGGYFMPDNAKAEQAMRPSKTMNTIIANM